MQYVFFFPPFFFIASRRSVQFELSRVKYETWFFGVLDTRLVQTRAQEFKKFVVQFVLLCLSYLLMYILEKKNKKRKNKIKSLNFAESNAHRKTNARGSFEIEFFCLALLATIPNPEWLACYALCMIDSSQQANTTDSHMLL